MKTYKSVLLADASQEFLTLLGPVLEETGRYSVHFSRSGKEVLSAIRQLRPDILVLDAVLPDLNGLEVLRQVKTAALCLSSVASRRLQAEAEALGAVFLQKPVTPTLLLETLANLADA